MPHAILEPRDFTTLARFDTEMARIFERSWVHVADTTELPEPGCYVPGAIGRTPLLIVRGHDDQIRVFLNACPHRGATLAEAPGHCDKNFRCVYHGWSFATDGKLQGVPFREEFDCDLSGRDLLAVRTAVLGPLVFACLDPEAPPFETWAGELTAAFARFGVERWQPAFAFDYEVRTNWKTYVENGLDGYHIPFVHDFLAGAIDVATGANVFEAHGSYTNVAASEALTPPGMERGQFRFGMIFPNLIPVFSPHRLQLPAHRSRRRRDHPPARPRLRRRRRDDRAARIPRRRLRHHQQAGHRRRRARAARPARSRPAGGGAQRSARIAHHALREAGRGYAGGMTLALWCLVGWCGWAVALVLVVGSARVAQVLTGKKRANEFPSGVPHGGDRYWRLNRAQLNTVENLPIIAALTLIATLRHVDVDTVCAVALAARVCQSLIHIASSRAMAVNLRFTAFVVQLGCYVAIIVRLAHRA